MVLVVVMLSSVACSGENKMPEETVLTSGQVVRFHNNVGQGLIEYVSPLKRHYTFTNGPDRVMKLIARKERFQGKLGLYHAGNRWFFEVWKPSDRIVAEEAKLDFDSLADALNFLKQGSSVSQWVWNDNGYVVGYWVSPQRRQVNVSLYRFYLDGEPLTTLPTCDGGSVSVGEKPEDSK